MVAPLGKGAGVLVVADGDRFRVESWAPESRRLSALRKVEGLRATASSRVHCHAAFAGRCSGSGFDSWARRSIGLNGEMVIPLCGRQVARQPLTGQADQRVRAA
jgi:hypothetical protein